MVSEKPQLIFSGLVDRHAREARVFFRGSFPMSSLSIPKTAGVMLLPDTVLLPHGGMPFAHLRT